MGCRHTEEDVFLLQSDDLVGTFVFKHVNDSHALAVSGSDKIVLFKVLHADRSMIKRRDHGSLKEAAL